MLMRLLMLGFGILWIILLVACAGTGKGKTKFAGKEGEVKLMTLDPGHFHAALVQKTMYDQVAPMVHVYAPKGPDVEDHQKRIIGFNEREENPTRWEQQVYQGDDYLEKMLEERPGNVVVLSGKNQKKAEYIKACVEAGLNVLADKPMCIDEEDCRLLEEAFDLAEKKGVLLYDIMTERSEITTLLQKALVLDRSVFGTMKTGTPEDPAVVKESVHHFYKHVAGRPLKRPAWFFDTTQQGEGIVDVTTHLVDLVMWACFPDMPLDFATDMEIKKVRRWPTVLDRDQFEKVTRLEEFPEYLAKKLNAKGALPCYCNGEIVFALRGVHSRVTVTWNYQAPEGGGDTHFSVMRGTRAHVIIRQGKEQNYRPELYVEAPPGVSKKVLGKALERAIQKIGEDYKGVTVAPHGDGWQVMIPDRYRIGHEAHFRQVTERYLEYLVDGMLPQWEVPNMKAKYRLTTQALARAREQ